MAGFQKQVNLQPAPGVAGAFASTNTPATYVTGPGGLVSGALGLIVARFGWASYLNDGAERIDNSAALVADGLVRTPAGFVANEQQGLNTVYLSEAGMTMLPWQAAEAFTRGDFWAKMLTAATRGQKVFANLLDGTVAAAAAGATIAANAFTASFATNVMTVTVAPALPLKVGQLITGASIPANTYIKTLGTGTGGTGTYILTTSPGTLAAQAASGTDWIETKFSVLSAALINEIAKIGFGD